MEFPCMVYKVPGTSQKGPKGVNFDVLAADNEEELKMLNSKGWHPSLPAAMDAAVREESLKKLQEMDGKPPAPKPAKKA